MSRRILPKEWNQPQVITMYLLWITERGCTGQTLARYGGVLNRLAYWLAVNHDTELLSATSDQLKAWRSALNVERSSVAVAVSAAKAFYQWATNLELLERNPAWNIPAPKLARRRPRPISDDNLLMAIEAAPPRERLWLDLGAYEGLRCLEIAALRRDDIYDSDPEPHMIVMGKGEKERVVPLSPYVWSELQWHGLPVRGVIFRRPDGLPYTANYISKIMNEYLDSMGISDRFHSTRHRFATHATRAHPNIRVPQDVLGHANPATTAIYSAVSSSDAYAMVAAVQPNPWPAHMNSNTRT